MLKKLGFVLFLLAGLCLTSSAMQAAELQLAQGGGGDFRKRAEARFDSMCVFLKLDEKQVKQVREFNQGMMDEMGKLREQSQGDREAMRDGMQKIFEGYQKNLEGVLTAEQKTKLKEWNEAHPRRMGRGGRG
ncbi:hypothetical protein LLH00_04675 [bacterium]|nr:hypothetical protein [bacterium]